MYRYKDLNGADLANYFKYDYRFREQVKIISSIFLNKLIWKIHKSRDISLLYSLLVDITFAENMLKYKHLS